MLDFPNQLVRDYRIKKGQGYQKNARACPRIDAATGKKLPGLGHRTFYAAALFSSVEAKPFEQRVVRRRVGA